MIFKQIDRGNVEFNGPAVQKELHILETQNKQPVTQSLKISIVNHNRKNETMRNRSHRKIFPSEKIILIAIIYVPFTPFTLCLVKGKFKNHV